MPLVLCRQCASECAIKIRENYLHYNFNYKTPRVCALVALVGTFYLVVGMGMRRMMVIFLSLFPVADLHLPHPAFLSPLEVIVIRYQELHS